jgi:hypothetical protein
MDDDRLLRRLVDVNALVPPEHEATVSKRWREGKLPKDDIENNAGDPGAMPRRQPAAAEVPKIPSHIAPRWNQNARTMPSVTRNPKGRVAGQACFKVGSVHPNSEIRRPKAERNPKSEPRIHSYPQ